MNSFELANVIAPDFEEYTSIEIAILLRETILEIRRRQKASPRVFEKYQLSHLVVEEIPMDKPKLVDSSFNAG